MTEEKNFFSKLSSDQKKTIQASLFVSAVLLVSFALSPEFMEITAILMAVTALYGFIILQMESSKPKKYLKRVKKFHIVF